MLYVLQVCFLSSLITNSLLGDLVNLLSYLISFLDDLICLLSDLIGFSGVLFCLSDDF